RKQERATRLRRKWRNSESIEIKKEKDNMRGNETVPMAPPSEGWLLVVKRQLTAGGRGFPVGAAIPVEMLGRNYQAPHMSAFGGKADTASQLDQGPRPVYGNQLGTKIHWLEPVQYPFANL